MDGWLRRGDEWLLLPCVAQACTCVVPASALTFQSTVSLGARLFGTALGLLGASLFFCEAAGALRCIGIFFGMDFQMGCIGGAKSCEKYKYINYLNFFDRILIE